jgi:zinc protease
MTWKEISVEGEIMNQFGWGLVLTCYLLGGAFYSQSVIAKQDSSTEKIYLPAQEFVLSNGLKVLILPDSRIPMLSYQTWYKIGSRDEAPGITGSAHMLEHMMFQGAKKYTGKDLWREFENRGISTNAFTSYDYTGFYEKGPKRFLDIIMDIEVDRMRHLKIDSDLLKKELEVVAEERRMRVENSPMALLMEKVNAQMYKVHPYRWPIIGTMDDIKAYTPETLRKFYEKFYVPKNAVLVVVGDVEVESTLKKIKEYYEPLPGGEAAPKNFPKEEPLKGIHRVQIDSDVHTPSLLIAYRGLNVHSPERYTMDLLEYIMSRVSSSRLYRDLVQDKQWVLGASMGASTLADDGSVFGFATLRSGIELQQVEDRLKWHFAQVVKFGVTESELARSKNMLKSQIIQSLQTVDNKARTLAYHHITYGHHKNLENALSTISSVTTQDIRNLARRIFDPKNHIVAVLMPNSIKTMGENKEMTK